MARVSEKELHSVLRRIVRIPLIRKKVNGRPIGLFLLPDAKMRAMKKKFLPREKGPANVLAFPVPKDWPHSGAKKAPLEEIYLNKKFATKREAPILVLHGVLHLLGYDHKRKNDRIRMEKIEKEVIRKLGY